MRRRSARSGPGSRPGRSGLLGPDAGLVGAGFVGFEALEVKYAGGLRDADREPRRRDAARPRGSWAEADLVLCEDTRRTKVLLERHGIERELLSYHEHNEAERTAEVLPRLEAGERIALDERRRPARRQRSGRRLIDAALDKGVPVTVFRPVRGGDGARRERARRRSATSSSGTSRAPESALGGSLGRALRAGRKRSLRSSPRAAARELSLARRGAAGRPVAVCRELTSASRRSCAGRPRVAGRFAEPPRARSPRRRPGERWSARPRRKLLAAGPSSSRPGRPAGAADLVARRPGTPETPLLRLAVIDLTTAERHCKLATMVCQIRPTQSLAVRWIAALVCSRTGAVGVGMARPTGPVLRPFVSRRRIRSGAASTEGSTSELPRAQTCIPATRGVVAFAGRMPATGSLP